MSTQLCLLYRPSGLFTACISYTWSLNTSEGNFPGEISNFLSKCVASVSKWPNVSRYYEHITGELHGMCLYHGKAFGLAVLFFVALASMVLSVLRVVRATMCSFGVQLLPDLLLLYRGLSKTALDESIFVPHSFSWTGLSHSASSRSPIPVTYN